MELARLGLPEELPDREQWSIFQDAGIQLAREGFQAVLFHSSARPAGLCLCVFEGERRFAGVAPTGTPERVLHAPPPPLRNELANVGCRRAVRPTTT